MKKFFTLFAAVLFTASMFAAYTPTDEEVIILNDVYSASATDAGYSTHAAIAWGGTASTNSKKAGDPNNNGESTSSNVKTYSVKGNNAGKSITISISGCSKIFIYHEKHSERYVELRDGSKTGNVIGKGEANTFFTEVALDAAEEYTLFLHGTAGTDDQDFNVYAVKLVPGIVVPVTDPVASVEIDGPEAVYVGRKASYTATTDVKANAYKWFVNDEEVENATDKTFEFTPEEAGTFAIVCKAKNDNNADYVASEAINLVATVKPVVERVAINESTTWDFANAASANVVAENRDNFFVLANLDAEWAEGFAADALEGKAQYFFYADNKCFQGTALRFTTTVAGKLTVEFSNTGKPDRPYRHLYINGVDVNPELKSNSTEKKTAENIAIEAGDVLLEGMMENADDPEAELTPNMLRIYKITFTANDQTAIDNTNVELKAVKRIVNGQLLIEKSGVLYNAQGTVLK